MNYITYVMRDTTNKKDKTMKTTDKAVNEIRASFLNNPNQKLAPVFITYAYGIRFSSAIVRKLKSQKIIEVFTDSAMGTPIYKIHPSLLIEVSTGAEV